MLHAAALIGAGLAFAPSPAAAAGLYCDSDPYCGERVFPDPYMGAAFGSGGGYKGAEAYGASWYRIRTLRPRFYEIHDGVRPLKTLHLGDPHIRGTRRR
jgi:hypothetical protein